MCNRRTAAAPPLMRLSVSAGGMAALSAVAGSSLTGPAMSACPWSSWGL